MALVEFAASAVGRATASLRRRAIAYAAASTLFVAAILYAAAAALIALESQIGPVGARLVLAAFCLVAGGAIVTAVRRGTPLKPLAAPKTESAADRPRIPQLAMIVEAVLLGFAAARRRTPRRR